MRWNPNHPPVLNDGRSHWWEFWKPAPFRAFPGLYWWKGIGDGLLFLPDGDVKACSIDDANDEMRVWGTTPTAVDSHTLRTALPFLFPIDEHCQDPKKWPSCGWALGKDHSLHYYADGISLCRRQKAWLGEMGVAEPKGCIQCQPCAVEKFQKESGCGPDRIG